MKKFNLIHLKIIGWMLLLFWLKTNAQSISNSGLKNATINAKGELEITASKTSAASDFDWYVGSWKIHNKKLKSRLSNATEWLEFEATDEAQPILNGLGKMNQFRRTVDGKPFEGMSLTLFNPTSKLWSIYWATSDGGFFEAPVVGSFEGNVGTFYVKDVFEGKPIIVRAQWDITNPDKVIWSQAFSPDLGKTWETNWIMTEERAIEDMGQSRRSLLQTDNSIAMPNVRFDEKGELKIDASTKSSMHDFDFLMGKWKMYHARLNRRLENCKEWTEFVSYDEAHLILNGIGNVDTYTTNMMPTPPDGKIKWGKLFEGVTVRLFDPKTRLWSLYWVASNVGAVDPPMIGSFENNVGHFFCKDTFNGKNVIVVFRWDIRNKEKPVWSQAFSADNGKTWEWNWYNVLEHIN